MTSLPAYQVISKATRIGGQVSDAFIAECNDLISQGYMPHGSPTVYSWGPNNVTLIYQAFIHNSVVHAVSTQSDQGD
jgi:hypothetical protein